jgi:predicted AAA+ superfamily ATPase
VRLIDRRISELLAAVPALMLVGPRAIGKTTTALRHARSIVRLDRDAEAIPFRADPDAALEGLPEPVLLDEWQAVPEVIGAVKRAVDADARPGRFLVTGSVRSDVDPRAWPGTGRLIRLTMYGLTVREQLGRIAQASMLERAAMGRDLIPSNDTPDIRGYVALALRGGFPELALAIPRPARRIWLESYVEQLVTRDMEGVGAHRDV